MIAPPASTIWRTAFACLPPGDHVLCAVTGERIALEELRYWSVRRQEAYASPEVATRAMAGR